MISEKNVLAERIANGDYAAESELFTIYRKQIATIIQIRVGLNNPHWEDIFSETQTTILQKLREGAFDPHKGDLLSYIYGIKPIRLKNTIKLRKKERNSLFILTKWKRMKIKLLSM